MSNYIQKPFAQNGDLSVIPQTDGGGAVNFDQGYPIRYSEDLNTTGLSLLRPDMNYLFYLITVILQQYQQHGVPEFISAPDNGGVPFPYDQHAMVLWSGAIYRSLIGGNTGDPTSNPNDWILIDPYNELIANASPAFTGLPTAPTQPANTNDTTLATTAYADNAAGAAIPDTIKVKAKAIWDGTGSTNSNQVMAGNDYNVASVYQENDSGVYTITFSTPMANTDYVVLLMNNSGEGGINGTVKAANVTSSPTNKTVTEVTVNFGNGTNNVKIKQAGIIII